MFVRIEIIFVHRTVTQSSIDLFTFKHNIFKVNESPKHIFEM